MNDFPPIADYAFLSDCENSCLIAPGRVGRVAVPAPSRLAQRVRRPARPLGRVVPVRARNTTVPHHRRYVPGTMVVETTWHTPTGWLVVQDLLVIRKVDGRPRPPGRATGGPRPTRRPPESCSARPGASPARSRSRPSASRCSSTASTTGHWAYDGDGYDSLTVQAPGRRGRPCPW